MHNIRYLNNNEKNYMQVRSSAFKSPGYTPIHRWWVHTAQCTILEVNYLFQLYRSSDLKHNFMINYLFYMN